MAREMKPWYATAPGTGASTSASSFVVPSYLRSSAYVQQLEEAHRSRPPASNTQDPPCRMSLSSPASNASLRSAHKVSSSHAVYSASHRGITHDIIERAPPIEQEALVSLPTRWNNSDKWPGLELLADGLEVRCSGGRTNGPDRELESYAVRADAPMPVQCGIYYYEITILSRKRSEETNIAIGFASKDVVLNRPPGWEPDSWAYHGDDGNTFCCQASGKAYSVGFQHHDTIGCGVNFRTGQAFFTRNGVNLGNAFREIKGRLFPIIGMKKSGEHIRVNFGRQPFQFDIDTMVKSETSSLRHQLLHSETPTLIQLLQMHREETKLTQQRQRENREMRAKLAETSISNLAPPRTDDELIRDLIQQYLSHEGYTETAAAYRSETQAEYRTLYPEEPILTASDSSNGESAVSAADAVNRQKIRLAILEGNIPRAEQLITEHYPNVLTKPINGTTRFNLQCRAVIEMLRQANLWYCRLNPKSLRGKAVVKGHVDDTTAMDVDDSNDGDKNDDTDSTHSVYNEAYEHLAAPESNLEARCQELTLKAIEASSNMMIQWGEESDPYIKRELHELYGLFAFQDPLHHPEPRISEKVGVAGRSMVAEEVNAAILVSQGKAPCSALERLCQQAVVLADDLRDSDPLSGIQFLNVREMMRPRDVSSTQDM